MQRHNITKLRPSTHRTTSSRNDRTRYSTMAVPELPQELRYEILAYALTPPDPLESPKGIWTYDIPFVSMQQVLPRLTELLPGVQETECDYVLENYVLPLLRMDLKRIIDSLKTVECTRCIAGYWINCSQSVTWWHLEATKSSVMFAVKELTKRLGERHTHVPDPSSKHPVD